MEFSEEGTLDVYPYIQSTILLSSASRVGHQGFIHLGNPENFMAAIQIHKHDLIWKWDLSELLKELNQNIYTKKENKQFFLLLPVCHLAFNEIVKLKNIYFI